MWRRDSGTCSTPPTQPRPSLKNVRNAHSTRTPARADARVLPFAMLHWTLTVTHMIRPPCARGKKAKKKPPPKKAKPKVAQIFDCPFCGKSQSCSCVMDMDHALGTIRCDGCGVKYDARINRLSDPIDVYAEWIDQCVQSALQRPSDARSLSPNHPHVSQVRGCQRTRGKKTCYRSCRCWCQPSRGAGC